MTKLNEYGEIKETNLEAKIEELYRIGNGVNKALANRDYATAGFLIDNLPDSSAYQKDALYTALTVALTKETEEEHARRYPETSALVKTLAKHYAGKSVLRESACFDPQKTEQDSLFDYINRFLAKEGRILRFDNYETDDRDSQDEHSALLTKNYSNGRLKVSRVYHMVPGKETTENLMFVEHGCRKDPDYCSLIIEDGLNNENNDYEGFSWHSPEQLENKSSTELFDEILSLYKKGLETTPIVKKESTENI